MTITPARADGPLAVSTRNPRYFTPIAGPSAGRAVYLTGSHIWNNLHDGMGPGPDGIAPTNPMADAPNSMARRASFSSAMQQIFILANCLTTDGHR